MMEGMYLPQEFIADNINVGFYYDTGSLMQRCIQTLRNISMHLRRIENVLFR